MSLPEEGMMHTRGRQHAIHRDRWKSLGDGVQSAIRCKSRDSPSRRSDDGTSRPSVRACHTIDSQPQTCSPRRGRPA